MDKGGQGRTYKNKKTRQHKAQKTTLIVLGYRQIINKIVSKTGSPWNVHLRNGQMGA